MTEFRDADRCAEVEEDVWIEILGNMLLNVVLLYDYVIFVNELLVTGLNSISLILHSEPSVNGTYVGFSNEAAAFTVAVSCV